MMSWKLSEEMFPRRREFSTLSIATRMSSKITVRLRNVQVINHLVRQVSGNREKNLVKIGLRGNGTGEIGDSEYRSLFQGVI